MAGVEIQSNAISTLLRDFPPREAPTWTAIALILLFGAVGPLLALRFGPFRAAFAALGLLALYAAFVQFMFNSGRIVSFTYPELSLALGAVGGAGGRTSWSTRSKRSACATCSPGSSPSRSWTRCSRTWTRICG